MVISDIAAIGTTILHSLWQATLLAGILWVISRRQGLSARLRYTLAYATLVIQCLLSTGTFLYYRSPSPHLEATVKQAVIDLVAAGPVLPDSRHMLYTPDFWMAALVSCWLLSMLVGSLKLSVSLWQLRRMQRNAVMDVTDDFTQLVRYLANRMGYTGPLRLKTSRTVKAPMLIGHLKPVLLFPIAMVNRLTTEESETVILHELAHLRRYDHWFNLVQCLIEVVFYYHPAVHWIGARIREEREHCCDDLVLRYGPGRLPYARALLHFSHASDGRSAALSLTDGGGLLGRVRRFLDHQEISYKMKSRLLLLPLMAILVLVGTASYGPIVSTADADTPSPDMSAPALAAQNALSEADTLPRGSHQVTKISGGKTTRLRVEDGQIKELELDGKRIPEEEFSNYEDTAEEMLGVKRFPSDGGQVGKGSMLRVGDVEEVHRSLRKLEDLDFDVPMEGLQQTLAQAQITIDSMQKMVSGADFITLDGDIGDVMVRLQEAAQELHEMEVESLGGRIYLDRDIGMLDSIYTRSLDGANLYRHRLDNIEDIDDLQQLEAKEKVLEEALQQLEERKKLLRERTETGGHSMLDDIDQQQREIGEDRDSRLGRVISNLQAAGDLGDEPLQHIRIKRGSVRVNGKELGRMAYTRFNKLWKWETGNSWGRGVTLDLNMNQ
ncbi:MAG: M56 family metallopeptidase [Lewinella sp.]